MDTFEVFITMLVFFGTAFYYFYYYRPPRAPDNSEEVYQVLDNLSKVLNMNILIPSNKEVADIIIICNDEKLKEIQEYSDSLKENNIKND